MSSLEDMAIFVRVAELSNLSAAGRDLRLSPAVVSNRIQRLERRLGVRLLNRTTRRVNITAEGETYYHHCVRILKEVELAESAFVERRELPRGPLTVSVPNAFGRAHLAPLIPKFVVAFPDIQVRLHVSDRFVDLIADNIDVAIRAAELKDSSAIARKIAEDRRVICAAPAYLEAHPAIKEPPDLLAHDCLLLRFPGSQQFQWTLMARDAPVTLPVRGTMDSDDTTVLHDWCLAGHGLANLSLWQVADDLKEGRLQAVLPDAPPVAHGIHAVYPHSGFLPPRVRAFIDFLVEEFKPRPPWEKGLEKLLRAKKR